MNFLFVDLGHCAEFNEPGGVIQDQLVASCNEAFPKCDSYYRSSTAYKCKTLIINSTWICTRDGKRGCGQSGLQKYYSVCTL